MSVARLANTLILEGAHEHVTLVLGCLTLLHDLLLLLELRLEQSVIARARLLLLKVDAMVCHLGCLLVSERSEIILLVTVVEILTV